MIFKFFSVSIVFVIVILFAIYFITSNSYQRSLEAKVYYYLGNYEKARNIAKEAYSINNYNRMATTVMTQSNLALEYIRYNKQCQIYLAKIKELSKQEYIEKADKIRIKFMAAIMIDSFPKLTPTVLIDEDLKEQSVACVIEFKKIHEKIIQSL